jgi:3',5'-cyclic AMP phosphodiesterase CpdA
MTFRLAQISDSHLSADKPFFVGNFERLARHLKLDGPDLIVNTGDVSLNGAIETSDLPAARTMHDAIGLPYRVIPGNHDIGDNHASAHQPGVSEDRRARFVSAFGEDWWCIDAPGWRLLGVNSLIMGSGLAACDQQFEFIADAVRGSADRAIMLLIHKPLYLNSRQEQEVGGRYLHPDARATLFEAFAANEPKLVACGHVHQHRDVRLEGIHHIWSPATSFVVPADYQVTVGERMVGYVEHRLHEDGSHNSTIVRPQELIRNSLEDFPEAYGGITQLMPRVAAT